MIGASVLFVALGYIRTIPDAPAGTGFWTIGYGLWMLRLVCYLAGGRLEPVFITFLSETLQATASVLLLAGAVRFVGGSLPTMLLTNTIGSVVLWSAFTSFIVDDFLLRSIPLYALSGGCLIAAGVALLRSRRKEVTAAAQLVGVALVAWGLHKLDYPWLRPVEWFAPIGFLLSEFLAMLAAVGLLLVTTGRLRTIADRAEQRHEQSRARLVEAQRIARVGSWEHDLLTQESFWSDEEFRILGYQVGEVAPSLDTFLDRVHPEDRGDVLYSMGWVDRCDTFANELRVVHPDGTVLYVSETAEIVRDEAGQPIRLAGTTQDITEAKTAELALLNAKQEAEAANRAKSSFLATMSHELRTPLNAVIGFAQLLEHLSSGPVDNKKYKEYVGHIRESGEHLLAVINDILDLSRVEAGEAALNESAVDLAALVRRTAGLMEAKISAGDLELVLRLPDGLPALHADERAIKQILLNLLANAIKFTEPGGQVAVELALDADDLVLAVSDTGIGIDRADQKRIFEPFVQVESELNRRFEGTGLGLPLVRSLVELHGGHVSLTSRRGEGTRVSVHFPSDRLLPEQDQSPPARISRSL